MKALNWLAVAAAAALLACGGGAAPDDAAAEPAAEAEPAASAPADPTELDVADVAARMEAGEDIFLLDVRTSEELTDDGVIAGYHHIPIDELEGRLSEVPKDIPIVAY